MHCIDVDDEYHLNVLLSFLRQLWEESKRSAEERRLVEQLLVAAGKGPGAAACNGDEDVAARASEAMQQLRAR